MSLFILSVVLFVWGTIGAVNAVTLLAFRRAFHAACPVVDGVTLQGAEFFQPVDDFHGIVSDCSSLNNRVCNCYYSSL